MWNSFCHLKAREGRSFFKVEMQYQLSRIVQLKDDGKTTLKR